MLKKYQDQKHPEFIYKQNRERLIQSGWKPPTASPLGVAWQDEPQESSSLHLPELPVHVRDKQVRHKHG